MNMVWMGRGAIQYTGKGKGIGGRHTGDGKQSDLDFI